MSASPGQGEPWAVGQRRRWTHVSLAPFRVVADQGRGMFRIAYDDGDPRDDHWGSDDEPSELLPASPVDQPTSAAAGQWRLECGPRHLTGAPYNSDPREFASAAAVCTHPSPNTDGICLACGSKVALAVPMEFARAVAAIHASAAAHDRDPFGVCYCCVAGPGEKCVTTSAAAPPRQGPGTFAALGAQVFNATPPPVATAPVGMETAREVLADHAVACRCRPGYADRGLVAPDCQFHDALEAMQARDAQWLALVEAARRSK